MGQVCESIRALQQASGSGQTSAAEKEQQKRSDLDRAPEDQFPMWCMDMATFMQMSVMLSHGQLLHQSALRESEEHDIVHFISHEWLSKAHPDPQGTQLRRAQGVFSEVAAGQGADIFVPEKWEMFRTGQHEGSHQLQPERSKQLTAEVFARDVISGTIWLDFASIPQVCDVPPGGDLAQQIRDQQAAILSISTYIEHASYFWILVPLCLHTDKQGCRDLTTYRRRAWCRLEESVNLLSSKSMMPIVVTELRRVSTYTESEYLQVMRAHPYFGAHSGDATCCELQHQVVQGGVAKSIPCDKVHMIGVLSKSFSRSLKSGLSVQSWRFTTLLFAATPAFLTGDELASCRSKFGEACWQCIPEDLRECYLTPLSFAVLCSDMEGVQKALVTHDASTAQGLHVLFVATQCRLEIADLLFASGAIVREDINRHNRAGQPPLLCAAVIGHQGMVERLLLWRADVNLGSAPPSRRVGSTALHAAAGAGHTSCCLTLLQQQADVQARDSRGFSPLHQAFRDPIHPEFAGIADAMEIYKLLLEAKGDATAQDDTGRTPSDFSADWGLSLEHIPAAMDDVKTSREPQRASLAHD